MKVPEEPSPVPVGISATLTSSSAGSRSWHRSTSRIIAWSIWSILSTRSISEYLRRYPGVNVRLSETKMYLLMAAAITLPPNRW